MSKARTPRPTWKNEFLRFFGSLKLAILLLLAIAGASTIGTVIPQGQGPGVIETAQFHPALKAILLGVRAHDVYHAVWFGALLALLFLNLAVCTYMRFPPTWRRYRMSLPPAPPTAALQEALPLALPPSDARLDVLRKRDYRVAALPGGGYFAEKNKLVRLGPTIIHLALFLIIIGAVASILTGVKNAVPLHVGETTSAGALFDSAYAKGSLARRPQPFDLRLDNFRMVFRPNGMVKQYYSDLTITPKDGAPYTRTVWVNEPLTHEGVTFYQSFWAVSAVTYAVDGTEVTLPLTQAKVGGFMSGPFKVGDAEHMFFLRDLNQPVLLVETARFEPVARFVPGTGDMLAGHRFELLNYHLSSGLEVKQDAGIPIVYLGCGFLILGLALVPFCHRELWLREEEGRWVLAGRTHKGRVMLRREMELLATHWDAGASAPPSPIGARVS